MEWRRFGKKTLVQKLYDEKKSKKKSEQKSKVRFDLPSENGTYQLFYDDTLIRFEYEVQMDEGKKKKKTYELIKLDSNFKRGDEVVSVSGKRKRSNGGGGNQKDKNTVESLPKDWGKIMSEKGIKDVKEQESFFFGLEKSIVKAVESLPDDFGKIETLLLEKGINNDEEQKIILDSCRETGMKYSLPLLAARKGRLNIVKKLINHYKFDVNTKHTRNETTPLHQAMYHGHLKVVKFLLSKLGSNPDKYEYYCRTKGEYLALHGAVMNYWGGGETEVTDDGKRKRIDQCILHAMEWYKQKDRDTAKQEILTFPPREFYWTEEMETSIKDVTKQVLK